MKTSTERITANLSMWKVLLLIFIPPLLLMAAYALAGYWLQDTMPSLLLFYLLALSILFPIQLLVIKKKSVKQAMEYDPGSRAFNVFFILSAVFLLVWYLIPGVATELFQVAALVVSGVGLILFTIYYKQVFQKHLDAN